MDDGDTNRDKGFLVASSARPTSSRTTLRFGWLERHCGEVASRMAGILTDISSCCFKTNYEF